MPQSILQDVYTGFMRLEMTLLKDFCQLMDLRLPYAFILLNRYHSVEFVQCGISNTSVVAMALLLRLNMSSTWFVNLTRVVITEHNNLYSIASSPRNTDHSSERSGCVIELRLWGV